MLYVIKLFLFVWHFVMGRYREMCVLLEYEKLIWSHWTHPPPTSPWFSP